MENARDDIPVLDEPVFAGAKGASDAPAADVAHPADASPVDVQADAAADLPDADRHREELRASFNDRISYLCKLAALVVAVVALATMALGQEMPRFVLMGLCLSVALLAIAMLQDHAQRRR